MSKAATALKRIFVGRPMSSGEMEHTLLPKTIALPVFASDPLSSNAYATQEAMIVLALAGAAGLSFVVPISFAVACVLAIVIFSYRQTVRAYPAGGGAYRVSAENLGKYPGLLAASALLGDYVLTVAVSITAGTDAILSAAPEAAEHKVGLAIAFVGLVTLMNLRGAKESGTLFAIPTYGFVASIYVMLISGFVRCLSGCPQAESADLELHVEQTLAPFLILRAFAAGTTALTGVEAIADGTAAFRYPQSKNAATTLAVMGCLTISMFLGISILADVTNVRFVEGLEGQKTVVAQIGHAIFEGGFMFYLLQAMTAAILILAANTAYADFPRLSSILASDDFMPRQFRNRGDRLVFSNGVIILAVLAAILIWAFKADLNRLIQLYLVGVFISFTLSQTGLVVRFRKLKEPGWRRKVVTSGFGAIVTGVVLVIIAWTKFSHGAWIIMASIPVVMFLMRSVHKHYALQAHQLHTETRRPVQRRPGHQHMILYVDRLDAATARAIGYARSVRPAGLTAVTFDDRNVAGWPQFCHGIEIVKLSGRGGRGTSLLRYLRDQRSEMSEHHFLTVIIPELLKHRSVLEVLRTPALQRLKARLVKEPGIQVMNVTVAKPEITPDEAMSDEPARNYVVVLVGRIHNAALQAIEYAETLRPTDLRAVFFGLDPESTERVGNEWLEAEVPHPLEIEDAPFRDLGSSLVSYIRGFEADGVHRVVTVIIPEFVVKKRLHAILHGQTALLIKRYMLIEQGVVVVSVPYKLED